MNSLQLALATGLAILLAGAVYTDVRARRIPNRLVGTAAAFAVGAHALHGGLHGAGFAIAGAGAALALLLPFYVLKGMAAGDLKLMAAVGSFGGPGFALVATLATLLVGGVVALGYAARQRRRPVSSRSATDPACGVTRTDATTIRIPYAPAIALGVLLALALVYLS